MDLFEGPDTCFVCSGQLPDIAQETAYHWMKSRALCLNHKEACVLPSGERLYDFMARWTHNFPLEGSGLGHFINPVTVQGCKGWCDFLAGGMAVYEELFPSQSYFEFSIQHQPWGRVDLLYALHSHRTEMAADFPSVLRTILALNDRFPEDLWRSYSFWDSQRQIDQMLIRQGKTAISSPDEIPDIFNKVKPLKRQLDDPIMQTFIAVLLDLAEVRFRHIKANSTGMA